MTQSSNPFMNMPIIGANSAVINDTRRMEIVGCKSAAGSAVAGELYAGVTSDQIASLFGDDSEIADAFYGVREEINNVTPIDIISIVEPVGGTADQKSVTFSGAATAGGTVDIAVLNERYGYKSVAVPKLTGGVATDAADIAALVAAAYASVSKLPVTIAVDGVVPEQVNATYNHKGAQGAGMTVWVRVNVPGVTAALAVEDAGTGAPDLATTYDVNGSTRYTGIAQPGEWSTSELTDFVDARFNVANKILDSVGFVCTNKTGSAAISDAAAQNSPSMVVQYENIETASWFIGSSMVEGNLVRSAQLAALRCLRLSTGADVSAFVSGSTGVDDTVGGVELSSLPYMNSPMPWPVMNTGFGYTDEVEAIKDAGGTIAGNNDAGTGVVLDEVVTTYKTNAQGDADLSFKYLNYVDTSTEIRSYMQTNAKKTCRQSRLTAGGIAPRRNMKNRQTLRAMFVEFFADCGDLLLAQTGPEAEDFFAKHLSLEIDVETGNAVASMKVPQVTQLRRIDAPIQVAFNLNG